MKRYCFHFCLCCIFFLFQIKGNTQSYEDFEELFSQRKLDSIVFISTLLRHDLLSPEINSVIGRTYCERGDYQYSYKYLTRGLLSKKKWQIGWNLALLGNYSYLNNDLNSSKKYYERCIEISATKNSTNYAKKRLSAINFDNRFDNWISLESKNIIFHFQDTTNFNVKYFCNSRQSSFDSICEFFSCKLPKKIDFFVWNSNDSSITAIGQNSGFSIPELCLIHSRIDQSRGHEIAHVISYYSIKSNYRSPFIDEGISVYFDFSANMSRDEIKKIMKSLDVKEISVEDVWKNWEKYPEQLSYWLSGEIMKEIFACFPKQLVFEFLLNQTFENANFVFGEKIHKIISDIESSLVK